MNTTNKSNKSLEHIEKDIKLLVEECDNIQIHTYKKLVGGKRELHIELRDKACGNSCPNFSDNRDDCVNCRYSKNWHQVNGRCVPRENIDLSLNYGNLPIDRMHLNVRKKRIINGHKIHKHNKIVQEQRRKKVEEEAVWV